MVDELATKSNLAPEVFTTRTLVATPDGIAAHMRTLSEICVNHHVFCLTGSEQWPNYWDAVELLTREVIPRVRGTHEHRY